MQNNKWRKDTFDDKISEDTQEEDSTHDEYDQDGSILFDDDEDSTASQEDDLEDWIEHKKEARQKLMKNADIQHHKLGLTRSTSPADRHPKNPDRWTRKAAEWNPRMIISTKTKEEQEDQSRDERTT